MQSSLAVEAASQALSTASRVYASTSSALASELQLLSNQAMKVLLGILVPYLAASRSVQTRETPLMLNAHSDVKGEDGQRPVNEVTKRTTRPTPLEAVAACGVGLLYYQSYLNDDEKPVLTALCVIGYAICFWAFFLLFPMPTFAVVPVRTQAQGSFDPQRIVASMNATLFNFTVICLVMGAHAALIFKTKSELLSMLAGSAVVFILASLPVPPNPRIWLSAIVTLAFAVEFACIVWFKFRKDESIGPGGIAAIEFFSEFVGIYYVALIASVLRYETSRREASPDDLETPGAVVPHRALYLIHSLQRYVSKERSLDGGLAGYESLRRVSLPTARPSTTHLPLFKLLMALVVIGRVVGSAAFVVAHYLAHPQPASEPSVQRLFLEFVHTMPSQIGLSNVTPVIVLFAMALRKDRKEMWNYNDIPKLPEESNAERKV